MTIQQKDTRSRRATSAPASLRGASQEITPNTSPPTGPRHTFAAVNASTAAGGIIQLKKGGQRGGKQKRAPEEQESLHAEARSGTEEEETRERQGLSNEEHTQHIGMLVQGALSVQGNAPPFSHEDISFRQRLDNIAKENMTEVSDIDINEDLVKELAGEHRGKASGTGHNKGDWATNRVRTDAVKIAKEAGHEGDYTLHHKISQEKLNVLHAALSPEQRTDLGSDESNKLLSMPCNLEIGPRDRPNDPGSKFDGNTNKGVATPRTQHLSVADGLIPDDGSPMTDTQKAGAVSAIKGAQAIHGLGGIRGWDANRWKGKERVT